MGLNLLKWGQIFPKKSQSNKAREKLIKIQVKNKKKHPKMSHRHCLLYMISWYDPYHDS